MSVDAFRQLPQGVSFAMARRSVVPAGRIPGLNHLKTGLTRAGGHDFASGLERSLIGMRPARMIGGQSVRNQYDHGPTRTAADRGRHVALEDIENGRGALQKRGVSRRRGKRGSIEARHRRDLTIVAMPNAKMKCSIFNSMQSPPFSVHTTRSSRIPYDSRLNTNGFSGGEAEGLNRPGILMDLLIMVIASTLFAGLAMPLGAAIAIFENIQSEWIREDFRHRVMAFGGGALLSAVALILVPEGIENLEPASAAACFVSGGLCFMALDIFLQRMNTPASQLAAMLSDFIPESIALGAAFATGSSSTYLLAGLIALQNLPEGFNAYRELNRSPAYGPRRIVTAFVLMALLGPIAGVSGLLLLADSPVIVSAIMLFAAGGILYSIFQDIAPQVKLEEHWGPPMGAIWGFVLGMVGSMLVT